MTDVYEKALRKLQKIIEREGDADGVRLTAAYFLQLVEEEIQMEECRRFFSSKERR